MGSAKHWSYSTGERGRNRVRAYEDPKSGTLLLEFYEQEPGSARSRRKRMGLEHRDRKRAKQQADEIAAAFGKSDVRPTEQITLRCLFDIYLGEVTPSKGESKRKHDERSAEMFLRFLGPERKAATLNRRDWDRFVHERRRGAVGPTGAALGRKVGDRQIAYDLKFLLGVLNWGTLAGDERGAFLERNPLRGLPLPKNENPQRPIVSQERYEAMLAVAGQVHPLFELALVLAQETGHRISSIRQLRWSDIDLERGWIRWRAENDKTGHEHQTPLSAVAAAALEKVWRSNPAIGETWVFPAPGDSARPGSRFLFDGWWDRAEMLAGLEKVPRLGWHGLRRKFATELKDAPLKDLCHMGGWKNAQTVLTCYQRPDEETMRNALENRKQYRAG